MTQKLRTHSLEIWLLGLGYFIFYTPYSGMTKALANGLISWNGSQVPGPALLPVSVLGTLVCMWAFITVVGWWKMAGRKQVLGVSLPLPRTATFMSGICMAIIIATTTLAFSFGGLSIVLVLVLLRCGVLVLAPIVDAISKRNVRWFSWAAMITSLIAVGVALSDATSYTLTLAARLDIAAYLVAYFFKFRLMTRLAKTNDRKENIRYFVEEQIVATPLLLITLSAFAFLGSGVLALQFRAGFTSFLLSGNLTAALLVGLFYAALCVCTTFIFLDCRENTFCVPMHCGSSMLAGIAASFVLALRYHLPLPGGTQLVSAGFIFVALGFLSPLHHAYDWIAHYFHRPLLLKGDSAMNLPSGGTPRTNLEPGGDSATYPRSEFLFVCSGNTCRSPMAAAISNAEIASRSASVGNSMMPSKIALSAGLTARPDAPMTKEAENALREIGIDPLPHKARNITSEVIHRVEHIFCMTSAHRDAVLEMSPEAGAKTLCLDPDGDIADPTGGSIAGYITCALRLRDLIRLRFDELEIQVESVN